MDRALVNFGKKMTRYMKERNESFRDMSSRIGINPSSLNDYANAKRNISITYAIKIARYFGKTVEEMVADEVNDS